MTAEDAVAVGCVVVLVGLSVRSYLDWRRLRRTPEYRRRHALRRFHRAIRDYPDAVRERLIDLYLDDEEAVFGRR